MTYGDLALAEEEDKLETAIAQSSNLLIEAPTGSGKSLFIPYFLSKHCKGRVVVLQPRRIAALALAQFSARTRWWQSRDDPPDKGRVRSGPAGRS